MMFAKLEKLFFIVDRYNEKLQEQHFSSRSISFSPLAKFQITLPFRYFVHIVYNARFFFTRIVLQVLE